MRTHHLTAARAGASFGFAFGVGGFLGTVLGGALSDWLGRRDVRWRQGVPAVGVLLSALASFVAFTTSSLTLSVVCLMLTYVFGLAYYAPTFACLQSLVPDRVRATAAGILLFFLTLVGASLGPWLVGFVSDLLAPTYGALSLRHAMSFLPITMVLVGTALLSGRAGAAQGSRQLRLLGGVSWLNDGGTRAEVACCQAPMDFPVQLRNARRKLLTSLKPSR
jgi:MFS family permease